MSKREQSALAQAQPNVSNLVVDNVHAVTKGLDVVTFSSSVFSLENIGEVVEDRRGYKIETKI